jgi:hypothetical protein
MITYQFLPLSVGEAEHKSIMRSDGWSIPFDPANTDAIEFCKWLKSGGIPEAADGGTTPTQDEINAIIAKLS